ncbi:DUF1330 domain-containing protein [Yoonia sp. R2331]|uniref:DUF1330 domain-containing protein n=1 Tax=Yoonia sp. R2331 TaxID=3237238 RepID=UPI0034E4E566
MKSLLIALAAAATIPVMVKAEPAYLIAQIGVENWDAYMGGYGAAAAPTVFEYGGRVLTASMDAMPLEGDWAGNWTVVIEFESMDKAQAWYADADYVAARPLRHETTSVNNLVFAPGFVPPQ